MKLLAKPNDFYNIEIDVFGSATPNPTYTITVSDQSDDGLLPLCDKLNEIIDKGYRFIKCNLDGDDLGWKYFEMELQQPKK